MQKKVVKERGESLGLAAPARDLPGLRVIDEQGARPAVGVNAVEDPNRQPIGAHKAVKVVGDLFHARPATPAVIGVARLCERTWRRIHRMRLQVERQLASWTDFRRRFR